MIALTRTDVETWLYREARLLDEGRLDEWMELWAPDGRYWIPSNEDDYDHERHVSLVYKDRARLRDRVDRLTSGDAYAQQPPSRVRHLISNVEIAEADGADELVVRSNFLVAELRRGVQDLFVGWTRHVLRRSSTGDLAIVEKKVHLLANDEPIDNLTFLL